MKRSTRIMIAATALTLAASGSALAFHEGGVAYCDGCHTMHNSSGNLKMTVGSNATGTANAYLLQGSDQSSTCLKCHSGSTAGGYKIATYPVPGAGSPPLQLGPGGDFSWVQKDYAWTSPRSGTNPKDRHGHNIVASDFGFTADAKLTTSPGGTYPNTSLTCISCHDPHGKYRITDAAGTTIATGGKPIHASGSYGEAPTAGEAVGVYRLLGGTGYKPASVASGLAFSNTSPVAVAPSTYNRAEDTAQTRVAYGKGMSEWCGNCHAGLHNDAYPTNLRHPAGNGAKMTTVAATYNQYVKSGDLTGVQATAYNSMVPFEEGTTDLATLASHADITGTKTAGADVGNNVMCLSCHRAHASGFTSMTRWNNGAEFLTVNGDYANYVQGSTNESEYGNLAAGMTRTEYKKAMYDRPATQLATFQRSMCNKCHAKD
jgi:hypothetical protein